MGTLIMKIKKTTHNQSISINLAILCGLLMPLLILFQPHNVVGAPITCSSGVSGCHFKPAVKDGTARNVPDGSFTGNHARHSGYSTSSAKRQYQYACTKCHPSGAYGNAHQTGFKNITGSSLPGNSYTPGKKIANTNNPAFGNCSIIYCHSNGRGANMGQVQYSSAKWGGTKTCLGCHGGRNGANPARSVGNFTLTTSHSQHLKYPAANINCQLCHAKTATDAATLKSYTGVQHHINGVREVTFTNIAYGNYTSYKSTEAGSSGNTKSCSNTSCHGGKSRGSWSNTVQNTDHQCSHCHGTAGTSASTVVTGTSRYNLRFFAPGYKKTGTVGTSTDQIVVSNDNRVGSHFKHLSSAYMKNIKCNECHKVPSTPFSADTNHTLNTLRYNSGTLDFAQSSSARILIGVASGSTPAQLTAFAGYTNGTATKAATCSSVYCHGSRLKNGAAGGTYLKPYWNYSAMINYTNPDQACARCHGNPPTSVSGSHLNKTATTSCSGCHGSVVDATGKIINKDLHINGQVNASGGHEYSFGGSKHMPGGTGSITVTSNADLTKCTGCHTATSGGTYPVSARNSAVNLVCTVCHWNNPNFYTTGSIGCGDCHGTDALLGRPNGGLTFPNYSGSHTAHAAQAIACADCHNGYGTGNKTHGNYSGNKKTSFTNISVKFNTAKSGTAAKWNNGGGVRANTSCTTATCHGQKSPAWGQAIPVVQCARCHGYQSLATLNNYTQNSIAPGTGNIDTNRTTGITARGGMHQEHLKGTSNLSRKVRCIECHISTTVVNHASLDNMTTAAMTFSGVATALSHTPTVSRVSGIINCSTNECHHGGVRADGTAAGQSGIATRTLPKWNDSALLGNTTIADTCTGKCHNMPPGGAVATDTHVGLTASGTYTTAAQLATACSGCHNVISASATTLANLWADKNRHINGVVDASGTCLGCHDKTQGTRQKVVGAASLGVEGDDFMRPSRHVKGSGTSTAIVKNLDCVICHAEGTTASTEASPVTDGTKHANGTIDLRDVDTPASSFTWPGKRAGGATITSTDRDNMDTFCMRCHDSDTSSATATRGGAWGIAVNATNTALLTTGPTARRTTPFNTLDGGSAIDVRGQFNYTNAAGTGWASHHNLNQFTKRYTATYQTNNSTRGGWTANTSKDGAAMNWVTGLHCSDCHLNEANAHGSRNTPRMLMTSAGTDAAYTYLALSGNNLVCFRCHLNTVYSDNGTDTTKARLTHQDLDTKPFNGGYSADTRATAACLNCHGGATAGSIHGNNRSITPLGGSATKAYRFMYGSELGYGAMSDANWANTTQPSCYTSSGTWGGSCNSHDGTQETGRIGAPKYSRPLQ